MKTMFRPGRQIGAHQAGQGDGQHVGQDQGCQEGPQHGGQTIDEPSDIRLRLDRRMIQQDIG